MNVRAQISMVFHLDKCIGCHTCSIACKNLWTDRKGAEYMWWNNVETKPGSGYPFQWEDQGIYRGGWELRDGTLRLLGAGKTRGMKSLFHNTHMPVIDNYYEPWTYKYEKLIYAPEGDDQPTAEPISLITGDRINIKTGPNWDDDLSGSPLYARNDPNFKDLTAEERESLFRLERMVMFYLPRICNHCLNPGCLAACPSGAIYKRGEDGIVLVNQKVCRAWRLCVTGCPYKKVYYNWKNGKSEKCILCFPRLETGQVPACMHTCVGRIRYLGVMLYDADKIKAAVMCPDNELLRNQLDIYLDPADPEVLFNSRKAGIPESTLVSAQKSPVYKFVKQWGLALPIHSEFRTIPNLFYVLPLLPYMATNVGEKYNSTGDSFFEDSEKARLPVKYLASLFSGGNTAAILDVLRKLKAVRTHRRAVTVGDITRQQADNELAVAGLNMDSADDIFRMTALGHFQDRFVIPPAHREEAINLIEETSVRKQNAGFGFLDKPKRGL
ncbi:MAG TPA: nitrate reductase subunit beta [Bacteroidales bacterium]|jgi:nitrate reductase beta subunit|nr:nitrate reductase subunit beta [Bacteroidales bacterium]